MVRKSVAYEQLPSRKKSFGLALPFHIDVRLGACVARSLYARVGWRAPNLANGAFYLDSPWTRKERLRGRAWLL